MIRISSDDESPSASQRETLSIPSTRYERLSSGNLSSSTQILRVAAPCSEQPNAALLPDPAAVLEFDSTLDPAYLDHLDEDFIPSKRRRTYVSILIFPFSSHELMFTIFQINPVTRWLSERDVFLAEFHRLEGRGDWSSSACLHCGEIGNSPALYRCIDCAGIELMCRSCIVLTHKSNPLHHVEVFFFSGYTTAQIFKLSL
jgi:hypothetical protein